MTTYAVDLTATARRNLAKLDRRSLLVVLARIGAIADNPHRLGGRLRDPPFAGAWSSHVDPYRVIYEIDDDTATVHILKIGHRGTIYRP